MSDRSNSNTHNEEQPQPPPLMGGDGSHGPGVLVSTEQPRREENVDDETVTLQLQHPSNNDDNPILCSVVCNRRAIRASSSLIRNLLDNMGRDDEVLPPFSTEHIADELTLRRVVEFVTDVEPTIPEGQLTEDCVVRIDRESSEEYLQVVRASDFCDSVQDLLRKCVAEDGHRGGILNLLIAAHYLGCEKLKNATAAYLAMALYTCTVEPWCSSPLRTLLFGHNNEDKDVGGDPLGNVPLSVLAKITNLFVSDVAQTKPLLELSPKLFKSISRLERIWKKGGDWISFDQVDFREPTCHICLAMEQRLEFNDTVDFDPRAAFDGSVCYCDARWSTLVEKLSLFFAEQAVRNPRLPIRWYRRAHPDLTSDRCLVLSILVKIWQLNPNGLLVVPLLPSRHDDGSGGFDAIADCWKDYYHFATHKATAISVELDPEHLDVSQLVYILHHTTRLETLHVRSKIQYMYQRTRHRVDPEVVGYMELTMIQRIAVDGCWPFLGALPSSVKTLELGCINPGDFSQNIAPTLFENKRIVAKIEQIILDGSNTSFETIGEELHRHFRSRKKVLRVYFCNVSVRYIKGCSDFNIVAQNAHIEFYIYDATANCCKRVPSQPLPEEEPWAVAENPPFVVDSGHA